MVRLHFEIVLALLNVADRCEAPVALFYNLANGFHNAPNFFFNDDTVRRRDNITGIKSGVKVAAKVSSLPAYPLQLSNTYYHRVLYSISTMASQVL